MADLLPMAITTAYGGLLLSFLLSFVRLLLGPTLADRIVALDLMGFVTISFIATHTINSGQKAFLDIAITLALVAFLSTVAFARFMMGRKKKNDRNDERRSWKL